MKKALLTIVSGILSVSIASAQCTPDPQYANASFGLFPDSIPFLEAGPMAGVDFATQIDIKTFVDTTAANPLGGAPINIKIDAFKILSITGQPAGFEWVAGGPTWVQADLTWYNEYGTPGDPATLSPVQGCMYITAAADAVSAVAPESGFTNYPLVVEVDARIADSPISAIIPNGTWLTGHPLLPGALVLDKYVLRTYAATNVAEMLNTARFDVGQSFPNPATGETIISYNTPTSGAVDFAIYNMLGVVVLSETINSEAGLNDYRFDANSLSSGMYVYTMRHNGNTVTKRMIVK